jgi:hypothetical protein
MGTASEHWFGRGLVEQLNGIVIVGVNGAILIRGLTKQLKMRAVLWQLITTRDGVLPDFRRASRWRGYRDSFLKTDFDPSRRSP